MTTGVDMEQSSNADKQFRYRKKEQLRRKADQMLRKWHEQPWNHHLKSVQDIHSLIEAAIKLPSGWTDYDYANAEKMLEHVKVEIDWPINQITNDVRDNRKAFDELIHPSELPNFNADLIKAIENTNALASHLISALKLSDCNEADKAAALMEAMRFVGRTLANNRTPRSQATAMCLSTISPIYGRPDWFYETLANTISHQHPELAYKIGKHLIEYPEMTHNIS